MKEKILKLRLEGKTYNEIQKELNCAKSTISYHCSVNGKVNKENGKRSSETSERFREGI